jgi:hypothetical protein
MDEAKEPGGHQHKEFDFNYSRPGPSSSAREQDQYAPPPPLASWSLPSGADSTPPAGDGPWGRSRRLRVRLIDEPVINTVLVLVVVTSFLGPKLTTASQTLRSILPTAGAFPQFADALPRHAKLLHSRSRPASCCPRGREPGFAAATHHPASPSTTSQAQGPAYHSLTL